MKAGGQWHTPPTHVPPFKQVHGAGTGAKIKKKNLSGEHIYYNVY